MTMTLLDLVQKTMSSLDSFEVNSIDDNPEAMQVVVIAENVYNHITSQIDFPGHHGLFELNPSLDANKPVIMYRPYRIRTMEWIKYNRMSLIDPNPSWTEIHYLPLKQFMDRMYNLPLTDENVATFEHLMDGDSVSIIYRTDVSPQYYTTVDDNLFIFDSFDKGVDSTLQNDKTLCYGLTAPAQFQSVNSFVFDLDEKYLDLLVQEVKSLAWAELRQTAHQKAERMARRGWTKSQAQEIPWPYYGKTRR